MSGGNYNYLPPKKLERWYIELPMKFNWVMPLISVMTDMGGTGRGKNIVDEVVRQCEVDPELRQLMLRNGRVSKIDNQIHWAKWVLKEAGCIDVPRYGVWRLTTKAYKITARDLPTLYRISEGKASWAEIVDLGNITYAPPRTTVKTVEGQSWDELFDV
jgi:restriction endonuclease Mrr